jgi:hypothetical protein
MNLQAAFDGLLAAVALWLALGPARALPALRLGALLLGAAAVLGTLRFSGWLPLPPLHQFLSLLGAGAGLPLLALAVTRPAGVVARQTRYAWIVAVCASVLCVLLVVVGGFKLWSSLCAFVSALAILGVAVRRRDALATAAGLCMVLAFGTFAAQLRLGPLQPGDFLHIGLAAVLALLGVWGKRRELGR